MKSNFLAGGVQSPKYVSLLEGLPLFAANRYPGFSATYSRKSWASGPRYQPREQRWGFWVPVPDRARCSVAREYPAIRRKVSRFQPQCLTDSQARPGEQSEEPPIACLCWQGFLRVPLRLRLACVVFLSHDWHPDEVVVPLARVISSPSSLTAEATTIFTTFV